MNKSDSCESKHEIALVQPVKGSVTVATQTVQGGLDTEAI